jgi:hypothetical protein
MNRNRKLLDLAKDKPCLNCGLRDGSTVAAHSNALNDGKGRSIKAHDCFHAWLCFRCHAWLDQGGGAGELDPTGLFEPTREGKREMFLRAMQRTWLALWEGRLIRVA